MLMTEPAFEFRIVFELFDHEPFHRRSPGGRFWYIYDLPRWGMDVTHPYRGLGGMGLSSAEFIAAWLLKRGFETYIPVFIDPLHGAADCWMDYQDMIHMDWLKISPSGADVWGQCLGGIVAVVQTPITKRLAGRSKEWTMDELSYVIWHQGKELPTHEHFQALQTVDRDSFNAYGRRMAELGEAGITAWSERNSDVFVSVIRQYGEALESAGFVAPYTKRHLKRLYKNPDVLAAKGCGAMGAETIIIWTLNEKVDSVVQYCHEKLPGFLVAKGQDVALGAFAK